VIKDLIYNNVVYSQFSIDETGNIMNKKTNYIYKKSVGGSGYYIVTLPLGKRGKVKSIRLHKALAEAFIPNPNNYPIVHHKDENKLNCSLSNLEWTTSKQNTKYHLEYQSKKTKYFNNRKLTTEDVDYIRNNKQIYSYQELATMFHVSKTTIVNVVKHLCYK